MIDPSDPDAFDRFIRDAYLAQFLAYGVVLVIALVLVQVAKRRKEQSDEPEIPVSNWYPDPWNPAWERWWNGERWTTDVRPMSWPPSGPWDQAR